MYGSRAKAANAGGVARMPVSEMSQNAETDQSWNHARSARADRSDGRHSRQCVEYGDQGDGYVDYVKGANLPASKKWRMHLGLWCPSRL